MSLALLFALLCAPAEAESSLPVTRPLAPVAGSVVRSKEWVVRRGANKEEEFIGDVRYDSAGTRLSCDWALFKHRDRSWRARGHVLFRQRLSDGSTVMAYGEQAGHDLNSKRGYLEPAPGARVAFTRTPPGEAPDHGESGRISWDAERRVTMSAGTKVWGPRLELAADEAVYELTDDRLTLGGGRPVLRKVSGEWTTALKADEVVAFKSSRRLEARGAVRGWLVFHEGLERQEHQAK